MKIMGITYINGQAEWLLKGDSALLVNRKPFFIPEDTLQLAAHPCLVLRISKLGKSISPRFARRYVDAYAAGLHFSDEGALREAIAAGHSWLAAVSSDGSLPVGTFLPLPEEASLPAEIAFSCGEDTKTLLSSELHINEAIAAISRHITLRQGDFLFLCTAQPPFFPTLDQSIVATICSEENLYCKIK